MRHLYIMWHNSLEMKASTIRTNLFSIPDRVNMSLENFPTHFYYTTTPFSTTYEDMFDQLNSIISTKTTSYMVKMFSNNSFNNFTTNSNNNNSIERITTTATTSTDNVFESKIIIPLYVIIFVLAVVGNTLVLVTLIRNKRMRTVTNVYLLNLVSIEKFYTYMSISDNLTFLFGSSKLHFHRSINHICIHVYTSIC